MTAATTDLLTYVGNPGTATTLGAPGYTAGGTSITVGSTANFPTATACVFAIDEVETVNGEEVRSTGTYNTYRGIVASGTSITNVTWLSGDGDRDYASGAATRVYITTASAWANRLVDGLSVSMNKDGTLKESAVQDALNVSGSIPTGYTALATVPTLAATNGNNSFNISFPSVDYTDRLSKGMKLLIPRTVTPQTQVTSLNGTTQYWNKTSPAGMTFTDDFAAGAWIYITSYPAAAAVIASRYNGTSGWQFYVNTDGTIYLSAANAGSSNYSRIGSSQSVPLNRWVFVAAQLDMSAFTATTTTSYVMIDGVNVPASVSRSGTNPTALIQAGNLEVGSSNGAAFFSGKIAQAWVSSAKVTQANVQNFMYHGITASDISTNSIISAYSFGGNSSDLNTTNANNLTANGGVTATNTDSPFNANCYAIITSDPTFSTNTTMTVQAANGYGIPNETLGTSSYTGLARPLGFPSEPEKWTVLFLGSTDRTTTSTTLVSLTDSILLNPGAWTIYLKAHAQVAVTGTNYRSGMVTLSSNASTETNPAFTAWVTHQPVAAGTDVIEVPLTTSDNVTLTTQTTFTLMGKVGGNLTTLVVPSSGVVQTPTIIRAVCAYL